MYAPALTFSVLLKTPLLLRMLPPVIWPGADIVVPATIAVLLTNLLTVAVPPVLKPDATYANVPTCNAPPIPAPPAPSMTNAPVDELVDIELAPALSIRLPKFAVPHTNPGLLASIGFAMFVAPGCTLVTNNSLPVSSARPR